MRGQSISTFKVAILLTCRSTPKNSGRYDSYSFIKGKHASPKKNHAPAFKAKVALAALSGEMTVAELSAEFGVHQTFIHKWIKQFKESAAGVFAGEIKTEEAKREKQLQVLHAKIGQLTVERDFLAEAWGSGERLSQAKYGQFRP